MMRPVLIWASLLTIVVALIVGLHSGSYGMAVILCWPLNLMMVWSMISGGEEAL